MVSDAEFKQLQNSFQQLQKKLADLELAVQKQPGPTTNYTPLAKGYTGTSVADGGTQAGGGGNLAGGHIIEVRKKSDGSLLLWIGSTIVAGVFSEGIHITALEGMAPAGTVYGIPEANILNAILNALRGNPPY